MLLFTSPFLLSRDYQELWSAEFMHSSMWLSSTVFHIYRILNIYTSWLLRKRFFSVKMLVVVGSVCTSQFQGFGSTAENHWPRITVPFKQVHWGPLAQHINIIWRKAKCFSSFFLVFYYPDLKHQSPTACPLSFFLNIFYFLSWRCVEINTAVVEADG